MKLGTDGFHNYTSNVSLLLAWKKGKNFNNNQLRINKEIANLGIYNVKSDERKYHYSISLREKLLESFNSSNQSFALHRQSWAISIYWLSLVRWKYSDLRPICESIQLFRNHFTQHQYTTPTWSTLTQYRH